MTLEEWAAVGEIVGGGAILVSLIYVAVQIRQANRNSRASAIQSFSSQFSTAMLAFGEPRNVELHLSANTGLASLSESDLAEYTALLMTMFRMWESFFIQQQEGVMDKPMFDALMRQARYLYESQGARELWNKRKSVFTPEFANFLDNEISTAFANRIDS